MSRIFGRTDFFSLALLLVLCLPLNSQPRISYILPDICAPDMSTYVEIISPHSATGNFGADNIYLNNTGDNVRVTCLNPNDTNKIKIGPLVVSWSGRMISTHIFCLKSVTPNSTNWQLLQPAFRIPITVTVGGVVSNTDTVYLVQPTSLGDLRFNTQRVLGSGALGLRSRRGAMIVDSIIFGNGQYTVETADCDPSTAGEQGYLPFALIARGNITGHPSGTTIDVSAIGANGGPGGGGGAGRVCDNLNNPSTGGFGFTAGGPGALNSSLAGNPRQTARSGTGGIGNKSNGGQSLNGVVGGELQAAPESAGGGTGHPFGSSGLGCNFGPSIRLAGGNGAGSGSQDIVNGGGGGYATPGDSGSTGPNGGAIHGNSYTIPFAGGSGGGGGNPKASTFPFLQCAGQGGGGGGAVLISGLNVQSLTVSANGADGERGVQGQAGAGGCGSGGFVGVTARSKVARVNGIATGAIGLSIPVDQRQIAKGGNGRVRIDAGEVYDATVVGTPQNNRGVALQPIAPVRSQFAVIGASRNVVNPALNASNDIYIKGEKTGWMLVKSAQGNPLFTSQFDFNTAPLNSSDDDTWFIVAGLSNDGFLPADDSKNKHAQNPRQVFGQAGAQILYRDRKPNINDSRGDFSLSLCRGATAKDTVTMTFSNTGTDDLIIDSISLIRKLPQFRVLAPLQSSLPDTLTPGQSMQVLVEFSTIGTGSRTNFQDTVLIKTNVPNFSKRRLRVPVEGVAEQTVFELLSADGLSRIDSIDFGTRCLGQDSTLNFMLRNQSPLDTLRVTSVNVKSPFTPSFVNVVAPTQSGTFGVTMAGRTIGVYRDTVVIQSANCPDPLRIPIKGTIIQPHLTFAKVSRFATTLVGSSSLVTVTFYNRNPYTVNVSGFDLNINVPFQVNSPNPPFARTLVPNDSLQIVVQYRPSKEGKDTTRLALKIDGVSVACTGRDTAIVVASAGTLAVSTNKDTLFNTDYCQDAIDTLILRNDGTDTIHVTQQATLTSTTSASYRIDKQPSTPFMIRPGDSVFYIIVYRLDSSFPLPQTGGLSILIDKPKDTTIVVPLWALSKALKITVTPNVFNFPGIVAVGRNAVSADITVTNDSKYQVDVYSIQSTMPTVFVVNPSTLGSLLPGGSGIFTITFQPDDSTAFLETITIKYRTPNPAIFCGDSLKYTVTGTGGPKSRATVFFPRLEVDPVDTDVALNLNVDLIPTDKVYRNSGFTATVILPWASVQPKSVTRGTMQKSRVGANWVLNLSGSGIDFSNASNTLTSIISDITLGEKDSVPMLISDFKWIVTDQPAVTKFDTNYLIISTCFAGGSRRVRFSGSLSLALSPNPTNDVLTAEIHADETGDYHLGVFDALGNQVSSQTYHLLFGRDYSNSIDVGLFGSGLYSIVLRSPTKTLFEQLSIVR